MEPHKKSGSDPYASKLFNALKDILSSVEAGVAEYDTVQERELSPRQVALARAIFQKYGLRDLTGGYCTYTLSTARQESIQIAVSDSGSATIYYVDRLGTDFRSGREIGKPLSPVSRAPYAGSRRPRQGVIIESVPLREVSGSFIRNPEVAQGRYVPIHDREWRALEELVDLLRDFAE